jgi:hypothetical protein
MNPSGRGAKQITVIMLEGRVGTQPYLAGGKKKSAILSFSSGLFGLSGLFG